MQHTSANVMWFAGVLSEHFFFLHRYKCDYNSPPHSRRLFVSSDIRAFLQRTSQSFIILWTRLISPNLLFFPSKIKWPLQTKPSCWLFSLKYTLPPPKKKKLNDVCFLFRCDFSSACLNLIPSFCWSQTCTTVELGAFSCGGRVNCSGDVAGGENVATLKHVNYWWYSVCTMQTYYPCSYVYGS